MSKRIRIAVIVNNNDSIALRLLYGCNSTAVAEGWLIRWIVPQVGLRHLLTKWKPDGLIVCIPDPHTLAEVRKLKRPFVAADAEIEDAPCILPDDSAVGAAAGAHLLERGFLSFAGFGLANCSFSQRRLQGFRETVLAEGATYNAKWEKWIPVPPEQLLKPLPETNLCVWLRSLPRPAGVFVACDNWGWQICDDCLDAGLRVPEDVAVVGADNDEGICECAHPPMSSVDIPRQKIGQEAALLLGKLMAGEPPPLRPLRIGPTGVVTRRSSDITAVPDPTVAAALGIILKHADKPINVRTILNLVPATQHGLERGFRKYLGRTMLQEIRRVHVEQAKRLLALTELTLPEVARKAGFADIKRLGEAFVQVTGMTPTEYRLRFGLRP